MKTYLNVDEKDIDWLLDQAYPGVNVDQDSLCWISIYSDPMYYLAPVWDGGCIIGYWLLDDDGLSAW